MKTRAQVADSLGIKYSITNNRPRRKPADLTTALANRAGWYRRRAGVWDARAALCRFVCIMSLLSALVGVAVMAVSIPAVPAVPAVYTIAALFLAGASLATMWGCEELQHRAWKKYRELMPGA